MHIKLDNPLAFIDLETTGTHIVHDRIIEIAVVKLMPNGNKLTYTKRINPDIPIPLETSLIHGIYDQDVKDAPYFKQIANELLKFLQGCDLAGFNILRFDLPILVENFLRETIDFKPEIRKIIDVQKLFHLMEKRTLKAAYQFYCQKELIGAHNALKDTLATIEVFIEQIKKYENKTITDTIGNTLGIFENNIQKLHNLTASTTVDLAGKIVYNTKRVPVFNFGKHKGKLVTQVFAEEPGYYNWMMEGDFALDTKRKLTQIKLSIR